MTYNTFNNFDNSFYPIGKECLDVLHILTFKTLKQYVLPKEVWQTIWNYVTDTDTNIIQFNLTTPQMYTSLLNLGSVSRNFYKVIFVKLHNEIYELKHAYIDKCFKTIINKCGLNYRDESYSTYSNTQKSFYLFLELTQKLINTDKYRPFGTQKMSPYFIEKYKWAGKKVLTNSKHNINCSGSENNKISEKDYIYLSDIYDYNYESVCMWKCKWYTCLTCYIPLLIGCAPVICLCSPCIAFNEFLESCNHDPGEYDGPIWSIPFDVCDIKNKNNNYNIDNLSSRCTMWRHFCLCRCCC